MREIKEDSNQQSVGAKMYVLGENEYIPDCQSSSIVMSYMSRESCICKGFSFLGYYWRYECITRYKVKLLYCTINHEPEKAIPSGVLYYY